MEKLRRFLVNDIKDAITSEFETWELWTYFVLLPLGFIFSALVGYFIGTIYQ